MSEKISTVDKRARNFATIVYPESAPENWIDILSEYHIPVFISPIHDKDKNPTGEPKKPHYHVITMYDGKKSVNQAKEVFSSINGVGCEIVSTIRGMARYLCHLDNPEKEQYCIDDVICLCGADYLSTIGLPTDKYKAIGEMMDYCKDNDIIAYCDLMESARMFHPDWFRVLCDSSSIVMINYLKSLSWKNEMKANSDYYGSDDMEGSFNG